MLTTTFWLLRKHEACTSQYTILRKHLRGWGQYKPIPLAMSLSDEMMKVPDWDGLSNVLWALQAVPGAQAGERDRVAAAFSAEMLGRISGPPEHTAAVAALRAFSRGEVSREEVQRAATAARDSWDAWATWATWEDKGTQEARAEATAFLRRLLSREEAA